MKGRPQLAKRKPIVARWATRCRQCGAPPRPGRAWCGPCLARIDRCGSSDTIDYPTAHDSERCAPSLPVLVFQGGRT